MNTADPIRVLTGAELADGRLPINGRGGPSRTWLKVKVRHEGVFLIGGVGLGKGIQGLLVGERGGNGLVFRGTVEFGVSGAFLAELAGSPLVRPTSPFVDLPRRRNVTWLDPKLAVEVQYNDLTGGRLRAPVLRGLASSRFGASLLRA